MAEIPRIEAPERLETQRLELRRPNHTHTEALIGLSTDERVARTLGGAQPRDAAWRYVAQIMGHWEIRGFGLYAVIKRDTDECIGRIGYLQPEGWPDLELGWALAAGHWGHGYATEATQYLLDYALGELKLPRLISLIEPSNGRSIAVAERIGMERGEPLRLMDKFDVEVWSKSTR